RPTRYSDRNGQASLYAGGVAATSRWLSAATPPVRFDEHAERNEQASLYAGGVAAISRWLSAATPLVRFDEDAERTGQASLYAGGVAAISGWLSAATPPVYDRTTPTTPEGSQRQRPPPFDYSKYRGSYSIPALANISSSSSRDERTR